MEEFANKVVWITGASSGIGEALAFSFAKRGARLILSGRNNEALLAVQQKCLNFTKSCEVLPFDMLAIDSFSQIVSKAYSFYSQIDYLCNNAGMSQRSLIKDTPLDIDRKIMELDYFSQIALTKEMIPYFEKQKSGHVIVISSVAGKYGFHYRSAYSAAKHALVGFFETLRLELKEIPVYVSLVYPGRVVTNISFNALTSDGTKHGVMDATQAKGLNANDCAERIIKGVKKKKVEILIGKQELILVYLKRWFPSLYYKFVLKLKSNS